MTTEEVSTEKPTSKEDQFFGVRTTIDRPSAKPKEDAETEIIETKPVIDPDQDVKPKAAPDRDAELDKISDNVQKRIDKLVYQREEEKRKATAIAKENEEAVRYARGLAQQNQQYEQVISQGEARLVEQIQSRAQLAVQTAQAKHKDAYESGDPQRIVDAQTELINAQAEVREGHKYQADYNQRLAAWQQHQKQQAFLAQQQQRAYAAQQAQPQQAQQPQIPKPSTEVTDWAKDNQWFGDPKHRDMTAVAYAEHETLVRDKGLKPDSKEYFDGINEKMRNTFPNYFKDESASSSAKPTTVVAGASRTSGGKQRKVTLNETEINTAKKLGVPLEEYARKKQQLEEANR